MEVQVKHLMNVAFEVSARGHRVLCDQPRENGGSDRGMTPPEFLLAALATCAGYYAAEYLRTRQIIVPSLDVRVTAEKGYRPARIASFRIEVATPGLAENHHAGLLRSVKTCLIHNTLLNAPNIDVVLATGEAKTIPLPDLQANQLMGDALPVSR